MADIRVTGPDGSTFTFPAGTPRGQIETAMQQHYGGTPTSQAAPDDIPRPSMPQEDTAANLVQAGAGGVNRGLANMAGFPIDAMTGIMRGAGALGEMSQTQPEQQTMIGRAANILGDPVGAALRGIGSLAPDKPFGGGESIRDGVDATVGQLTSSGTMFPELDTPAGRVVGRIGEEIGATALPAAGLFGAAFRRAPGAVAQAPGMSGVLLDPIRNAPVRSAGAELATATGAGYGAGLAREAAPDSPGAEMLGQLGGGLIPSVLASTPTALATKVANAVRRRLTPEHQVNAARETVRDYFDEQLTTSARERLQDADKVAQEIPRFDPSLAERTQSPSIVKLQSDLEGRMTGQELDAAVARRVVNEDAVRQFSETSRPQTDLGADEALEAGLDRIGRLRDKLTEAGASVEARQQNVAGRLPEVDARQQGRVIRERLEQAIGDEHKAFERIATEQGLNDPGFKVPFAGFRDDIMQAYQEASRLKMNPGVDAMEAPPRMIARIQAAQGEQDFAALMELRSDISGSIRRAERMPTTDDTYLRGLRAMKRAFDGALEKAVANTNDPAIAERYANFRRAYREQYVEPFKQFASAETLARDAYGAFKTPDERVAQNFFSPGGVTAARQFKTVFDGDRAAFAALEATALDSLRSAAIRDGVIEPRAFQRWARDHASVLKEFPDLARRVGDIGSANDALLARQSSLAERTKMVENSLLAKAVRRIDADSTSPQRVIDDAMAAESPRRMNQIAGAVRGAGNADARAALQRSVWDTMADLPPGGIAQAINVKEKHLLAAGLTPSHLRALKIIDGARVMMSATRAPTGSANIPSSVEAFVRTFGIRPDMLANRLREIHTGRSEPAYVLTNVLSNVFARKQQQHMDEAFRLVLYDRELAEQLASSIRTGRADKEATRRIQARYFAVGITPFKEDGDARPEEERMLEFDVTPR
jgi:hypothetical protein